MGDIDRVLAAAASGLWALHPEKLAEIRAFFALRTDGVRFTAAEIEARIGPGRTGEPASAPTGVAVIPLVGIMSQRASMLGDMSGPGGTSTDRVGAALRQAVADPAVRAILLDVDSPGGNTFGVQELADELFRARGRKPVIAQVNSTAASAAYWVASAASEVVVTPGGEVGSIGVFGMHEDVSKMLEKMGVTKTLISAGPYKVEGNPLGPLSSEARAHFQERVDEAYGQFVGSVARGRGTTAARVRTDFGKGRMVSARDAVRLGMADRIGTLQDTLRRLGVGGPAPSPGASASSLSSSRLAAIAHHDDRLRRHRHRMRAAGLR